MIQDDTQKELKRVQSERPEYEIPSSIQAQLNLLRQRAGQGLPGQDLIGSQIQQGTAQGVAASREASTSAADLLGATTSLYGQQTQNMTDLQIAGARARSQNELAYAQGLGQFGEYQDKAWNWNQALPWQTDVNRIQGISQSAYDLMLGGLGGVSTAGSDIFGGMTIGGDTGGATDFSGYSSNAGYVDPNTAPPIDTSQYQTWGSF